MMVSMAADSSMAVGWHVIDTLNDPPGGVSTANIPRPKVSSEPMRGGHSTSKEQRHHLHRFQSPTVVLGKAGEALWTPGARAISPGSPLSRHELSKVRRQSSPCVEFLLIWFSCLLPLVT
ncbi:hypothetical protein B0H65DRAFT_36407 [Neurospora tetraspora]|uniref:Uncharacterized protein n=1 Tax=Neurospora tetraspora TaxID=94610 RepID=A0AAE0JPJ0_9PEZI|nr:hypothetical protein B0H65DRAFT_36407 [Neurospora tetraspora]